jgi:hypothetical protein
MSDMKHYIVDSGSDALQMHLHYDPNTDNDGIILITL